MHPSRALIQRRCLVFFCGFVLVLLFVLSVTVNTASPPGQVGTQQGGRSVVPQDNLDPTSLARSPVAEPLAMHTRNLRDALASWRVTSAQDKQRTLQTLSKIAQQRRDTLKEAIVHDPSSVLAVALSEEERGQFPDDVRAFLEEQVTLQGGLALKHIHMADTERSSHDELELVLPDATFVTLRGTPVPPDPGQRSVRVHGVRLDTDVAVDGNVEVIYEEESLLERLFNFLTDTIGTVKAYTLSPYKWLNPNVTASFMPDGTLVYTPYTTNLFVTYDPRYATVKWQKEFARALQSWAAVTPLNFRLIPDDGSNSGASGLIQGDTRFGDTRMGAFSTGTAGSYLAYAYYPYGSTTKGGDLFLNSWEVFKIGTSIDLYSVVAHEVGHTIGLGHSTTYPSVMYSTVTGVYPNLTSDDIAGIQAIYGPRKPDFYDAQAANNSAATATPLTLSQEGSFDLVADLSSVADIDYYRITVPTEGYEGRIIVRMIASDFGLLAPKVSVYNGATLLTTASAPYGSDVTVNAQGLLPGQVYTIVADGATADVFAVGTYRLSLLSPLDSAPPTVAISSPINGAFVRGLIPVTADAADDGTLTRVEFSVDNILRSTDTTSPYGFSWDTAAEMFGSHTITATAYDMMGKSTQSSPITVTVDNVAPKVNITKPANGASLYRGSSYTLEAKASDATGVTKVDFRSQGSRLCLASPITADLWRCAWKVPSTWPTYSSYPLKVVAYDRAGNIGQHAISVTIK